MQTVLVDKDSQTNTCRLSNINTNGEFKTKLENHMSIPPTNWTPQKLNRLFTTIGMGLTKFYDPNAVENRVIKILCLGKVQSGKTAFFIGTMAMAMDNGYSLFYVIGGTKNNLLSQNRDRIQKEFENNDDVIIMDINGTDTDEVRHNISRGYKVILMVLKHKNSNSESNLSELERLTKDLSDFPSIIVDDEGDEYSQANEKGDSPNKKITTKAIHTSLSVSMKNLKKGVYLSVTATPQSNLLVSTLNSLSPDDCILVEPGEGYTGASVFHDVENSEYVEKADDSNKFQTCIPDTFKEALRYFIIGCAIKKYKNDLSPHSMLIHPSAYTSIHGEVGEKVKNELLTLRGIIQNENDFAYDSIKKMFKDTFDKFYDDTSGFSFEDVWKYIDRNLDKTKVFIINRKVLDDPKKSDDLKQDEKANKYRIYIGGAMLERGITLDNLCVTYIYRNSKINSVDTLFQRARWFGYKEKYLDLIKIYMPTDLIKEFVALTDHEIFLWNTIREFLAKGLPMQKMERVFLLNNPKMQLTRTSITKTIKSYTKCSGYKYDKAIDFNENDNINNKVLYDKFINKYANSFVEKIEGNHKNKYLEMSYINFYNDFLSNYCYSQSVSKLTKDEFLSLKELVEDQLLDDKITVIDLKIGEDIQRSLAPGGKFITELPQGYNKTTKSFYPGDKNLLKDKLSIQLHWIYTTDKNEKVLLLALNNPFDQVAIQYVTGDNIYDK